MIKDILNIVIVVKSGIIYEGLLNILVKIGYRVNVKYCNKFKELENSITNQTDILIIDGLLLENKEEEFRRYMMSYKEIMYVCLVNANIKDEVTNIFDLVINIDDNIYDIINRIKSRLDWKLNRTTGEDKKDNMLVLTNREIDVLKYLVIGNSNKEIADKLNISTNTVITHRKNITQKTGIKSVSGLTVYAIINNIISIESVK